MASADRPSSPAPSRPTIIVTGASSGIGAYCASALSRDGWRVFATARKPADIDALNATGIECFYMDYREPDSISALVEAVLERTGGRLDALFNNGAHAQAGAVEDLPVAALREQFEANVFGLVPARYRGAYVSSKHALEGLMLTQMLELEGTGIHVSLIEPGPITSALPANGLAWFERNIDVEASVHRVEYQAQLARLRQGGIKSRLKLGPDAVYRVLRHALEHRRPRPHYAVTLPAKIGILLRRALPARALYRILGQQG
jgi:NAD(P)-dependent dehydrogenase (short-subunit alcohol dehydrogenase family)